MRKEVLDHGYLRMAPNAQWEIRQYANALGEVIKELHPKTWGLFMEGQRQ